MSQVVRRLCLAFAASLALGLGMGCLGVTQNPSYFPHLLPTGDIIRTHAKPPLGGYFSNFDPHACRLEVRPMEATNPVQTQHVLIATVYDGDGNPRRNRRVEWLLEGVGHIVEVDESGFFPGRGYKVDNSYAVSYTDYCEHTITRGNDNPNDDFTIRPGQTWCVISSAVEGDTHVTAYCPEIYNWDKHKVFVTKHWVDAEWIFPKPAINRAGTEHVFTTSIFRHTDKQPLTNYRVRYRILDGPPAKFLQGGGQEAVVVSDLNGHANVTLAQVAPVMGVNHIGIEIIRPPDPCTPSGAGIVLGHGETQKEWQAPRVTLAKTGPSTAPVGGEVPYNITITNTGQVETKSLTVSDTIPDGMTYVSSQPAAVIQGTQLLWTLGELPGGQSRTIQVVMRSTRVGKVVNTARVVTEEGLQDEKSVETEITSPQIKVVKTGPATGVVGVPITYDITVSNPGTGPATGVTLTDEPDDGLEHESRSNKVELPVGSLGAHDSKTVRITLTPRKIGKLINRVTATADGGISDRAQHEVVVQEARLAVRKTGPAGSYMGSTATWNIQVVNPGDVALSNVVVRDLLPPELVFKEASEGGQPAGNEVRWNIGTLGPKETKTVQLITRCVKMVPQAVNVAVASADPGLEVQDKAGIEIRGLPAFRLEVVDLDDPIEVGGKTTYKIDVTNQGSLPGDKVVIVATVPAQMKVLQGNGPTTPTVEDLPDGSHRVTYPPVDTLPPGQALEYNIMVEAVREGDVRFIAELRAGTLSQPVKEEESTSIFQPRPDNRPVAPAEPPPPPPPPPGGNVPASFSSSARAPVRLENPRPRPAAPLPLPAGIPVVPVLPRPFDTPRSAP